MRPGVIWYFTNILRSAFSYESFVQSLFVLAVEVKLFIGQEYWRKCAYKMLLKLTPDSIAPFLPH
jgi:hypothetical protein